MGYRGHREWVTGDTGNWLQGTQGMGYRGHREWVTGVNICRDKNEIRLHFTQVLEHSALNVDDEQSFNCR